MDEKITTADLCGKADHQLQYEVTDFLNQEARLLDDHKLDEWLDMLTNDIEYVVPVRVTREKLSDDFETTGYHFNEDRETLEARVERFQSDYSWSENPPSRIRHFVSNVTMEDISENEIEIKSNCYITRSQGDTTKTDLIPYERHDILRITGGGFKLARRVAYLDQTIVDTKYFSFFF